MKTTYDPEADATYIKVTHKPVATTDELSEVCILDLDSDGKLVGIELLSVFGFAGSQLAALVQRGLITNTDSRSILAALRGEVVAAA